MGPIGEATAARRGDERVSARSARREGKAEFRAEIKLYSPISWDLMRLTPLDHGSRRRGASLVRFLSVAHRSACSAADSRADRTADHGPCHGAGRRLLFHRM